MPTTEHSSLASEWQTPIFYLRASNLSIGKGFVNISTSWFLEEQWTSNTSLDCWTSLIKWYLILICFVRPWNTGFFKIDTAEMLSRIMLVASTCSYPKSFSIFLNHKAWFTTNTATMYSVSTVDWAMVSCFFELQVKKTRA